MPNHVTNEVTFRGVDADARAGIKAAVLDEEGKVEFGILVPIPPNIWLGNVGAIHEKTFKAGNALDWCRTNWGTKWGAYGDQEVIEDGDSITIRFDTAWGPPYGWLVALLNKFERNFEYHWLSEGESRGHSGAFTVVKDGIMAGHKWEEKDCDEAMQKHLHVLRWGCEEFSDGELA
jgi:hypothetical protein